MVRPGRLTLVSVLPERAYSLSKIVYFPGVCKQWPAERAPGLPLSEILSHPKVPALVSVRASGKSQELTQTVPFGEKVLAKMVAKQLQGPLSTVMISLSPFPLLNIF